jgi:hypothetical protein
MNQIKYEAYLDEFPILQKLLPADGAHNCEAIRIKRLTPEVLSQTPEVHTHIGSLVDIDQGDQVWLVQRERIVKVAPSGTSDSNYAHEERHEWEGESLLEACYRDNVEPELIVWRRYGYEVVEHCSTPLFNVIVYKPAKDTTVRQLIEEALKTAAEAVKAEAAF